MSNFHKARKISDGQTVVLSNGSTWNGDSPKSIEKLIGILGRYTLDPIFEESDCYMGSRYIPAYRSGDDEMTQCEDMTRWVGAAHYFGNFADLSHVFNIVTKDKSVSEALFQAIRRNVESEAYQSLAYAKYRDWFYAKTDECYCLVGPSTAEDIRNDNITRMRYRWKYDDLCTARLIGPRFKAGEPMMLPSEHSMVEQMTNLVSPETEDVQ